MKTDDTREFENLHDEVQRLQQQLYQAEALIEQERFSTSTQPLWSS
jgi:hypothetical protein